MTPAWVTVVIGLGGTLLGIVGTLWSTARQSARGRHSPDPGARRGGPRWCAGDDRRRLPRGARLSPGPAMLDHLAEVRERWHEAARPALLEFSVRTDSDEARRLARSLAAEVPGLVNIGVVYVQMLVQQQQLGTALPEVTIETWQTAKAKHAAVVRRAQELEEALGGG